MSCTPAGRGCVNFSYAASTNHINGYTYDAAGNVTNDTYNAYQWDAEGRLAAVTSSGSLVSLNTYNALGQRVEDVTQTSTTDEAYGAGGNLLVRYTGDSNSRSFVPFNGRLLAEYYCGGTIFDHPDEIGSVTTATDCTGNIVNEKLFYPFGELWTGAAIPNLGMHQTFAQLPDYDPETDQYNTANRHYSPSGRWMSPDPGGLKVIHLDDPQTWNLYAYVRNNPTTAVDPNGTDALWVVDKNTGQTTLVIPVHLTGSGATPENINKIVNQDNSLNTGGSPVKIQVISTDTPMNGVLNEMDFSPGDDKKDYGNPGEGVNGLGGDKGHINSENGEATGAAAHDILHFAGIKDQYEEGKPDANGNRTSSPTPGYDNSNIMTSRSGTNLKPEQVQEAQSNKSTKQCTTDKGQTVCK
jgi:RHS repeat-associated protein